MTTRAEDAAYFGRSGISLASTLAVFGDSMDVGEAWLLGSRERNSQRFVQTEQTTPSATASTGAETRQLGQKSLTEP